MAIESNRGVSPSCHLLCSIDSRPFDEIVLTDEDYRTSAKTALPI